MQGCSLDAQGYSEMRKKITSQCLLPQDSNQKNLLPKSLKTLSKCIKRPLTKTKNKFYIQFSQGKMEKNSISDYLL